MNNFHLKVPLLAGALIVISSPAQVAIDAVGLTKRLSPSVVVIKSDRGLGSGVVVGPGKIATSLHVIQDANTLMVETSGGDLYAGATVFAYDGQRDLAVLRVPGFDLPSVELGDSNAVAVGEPVVVIGAPERLAGSVTAGIVSAIREDPFGRHFRLIQTDAAVLHGNSGGPLINGRGQVIGIIWGGPAETLNFAVPVNYLRELLSDEHHPISLPELKIRLRATAESSVAVREFPKVWKSLSSTARYDIRLDGDYLYVERLFSRVDLLERLYVGVQRPEDIFSKIEAHRDGKLYVGKKHYGGTCLARLNRTNSCSFEDQIEFTVVSPSRIEGASLEFPADAKFDCQKCRFSKPKQIVKFVWIPE